METGPGNSGFIKRVEGTPLGPQRARFIMERIRAKEEVNWRQEDNETKKNRLAIEAAVLISSIDDPEMITRQFNNDLKLISEQFPFAA